MAQSGPERLAEYCERSRLKRYELADLLQMHESTLSQMIAGKRRPGLATALRIEEATGIPVSAWAANQRAGLGKRQSGARRKSSVGKEKSVA